MNLKKIIIIQLVVFLWFAASWGVNLYKLTKCDFGAPYKAEIVHAVGLFPPAGLVTCWFSFDETK
jgi:hypothetical protein